MSSQLLNMNHSTVPVVSVAMTAYNSAEWMTRALESVLKQRTEFSVEIVIGDDCSKDATIEIARSYHRRYPDMIKVLERDVNVGIQRNYYETFEQCRGKFIAWLDADDYWTDPDKLSIQAETLNLDTSLSACGHFVRWVTTNGEIRRNRYPAIASGRYGLAEILHHDFLPALSVMFRNGIQRDLPQWYFDLAPTTDWPLWILAALSGDILLIDRVMGDYWVSSGSALIGKGELYWYSTDARFYEHVESILPVKWHRLARAEKGKRYDSMAYLLRKQGNYTASREAAFKAFCSPFLQDNLGSKTKALIAAVVREIEWKLGRKHVSASK